MGLLRCSLIGVGAYARPDEDRYRRAREVASALLAGEVAQAGRTLTYKATWVGGTLLQVPPALVQHMHSRASGLPFDGPTSLSIPQGYNVLVSLALLAVFHALTLRLYGRPTAALLATGVLALLASSNLYLRHLLPYDLALLLGLGALHVAVGPGRGPGTSARWAAAGLLAAVTCLTYSGYYLFAPLVGWVLLTRQPSRRRRAQAGLVYAAGGVGITLTAELLSRACGSSILSYQAGYAKSITQGSYTEAWYFPVHYVVAVEGAAGVGLVLLAAAFAWGSAQAALRSWQGEAHLSPGRAVCLGAGVACLAHGLLAGTLLELFVFYGRLVHAYYPFLVLAGTGALVELQRSGRPRAAAAGWVLLIVTSALGAADFFRTMHTLGYPRDVLIQRGISQRDLLAHRLTTCSDYPVFAAPSDALVEAEAGALDETPLALVNFRWLIPTRGRAPTGFDPPPGVECVYRAPHWASYTPYLYEDQTAAERNQLQRGHELMVWRLSPHSAE